MWFVSVVHYRHKLNNLNGVFSHPLGNLNMSILAKVFDRGANFPVRHMNFNFEQAQHPLFRDNPWGEY